MPCAASTRFTMPALRSASIVLRVSTALHSPTPSNPSQTSASDSHSLRFKLILLIVVVSLV
jgi:hypothetical protein